jgi:putative DNA primase/helicase
MRSVLDAASGRWPELLQSLAHLAPDQLTNKHQPCPACGGTDRYRWDNDGGPGGCYCNRCGGKDGHGGGMSGLDLLMRVTGWDLKQAVSRVSDHLGPTTRPEPPTAGAEHVWRYTDTFYVCRFAGKAIRPLWWDGDAWRWKAPPTPRPLYWARQLAGATVLITEGEKAADAAAKHLPTYAVCTWPSGCKAISKADWSPLAGRSVVLWPDADAPGREAMAKLGPKLLALGCSVSIINPPDDLPLGWDLADAGHWKPGQVANAIRSLAVELPPLPEPPPDQPSIPEPIDAPDAIPDAPFTCLGFDDGSYYYQPGSTGQVIRLTGAGHTSTNLLRLARLAYWEAVYPSKTGVDWQSAISSLFDRQARAGVYSPDRIRGRGAWWDDNRCVLHLGDRLIVDGSSHSVMAPPPSRFNYQRLASIDIPTDLPPLTDAQGKDLIDIASRFHWEVPASGLLLAGWAALAPICGSLSWRPHVWLTAAAGSGKSAILDRFLGPLLDALALWPEGNTTEAFIRQELRADALPVVFDEAESNERADQQRIQNILALARVASSSGRGVIGKGGADGAAQRFTIRSMFLLCSISTALKQGADQSRFAQLTLRNPNHLPKAERTAHWSALDRDLTTIVTTELGHRLLLRSVRMIPVIRESVAVFRRAAADRFDSQRQGDQYGTLLAGAWALANSCTATIDDAFKLIDANDWRPYQEATESPDEERCLQHILQHQLRVETDRGSFHRTISELIDLANAIYDQSADINTKCADAHLTRIGLRVMDNRLLIANTALGLRRILQDTPWAHSWPTVLGRLPGAEKAGHVRFKGMGGKSRALGIPLAFFQD